MKTEQTPTKKGTKLQKVEEKTMRTKKIAKIFEYKCELYYFCCIKTQKDQITV